MRVMVEWAPSPRGARVGSVIVAGRSGRTGSTHSMKRSFRIALVAVGLVVGLEAVQCAPTTLGTYKAWTANKYSDKGRKVCYLVSRPSESLPDNVRRGDIFVMVTRKAKSGAGAEISFVSGYPFKEDSTAQVRIGSERYDLMTSDEYAWVTENSATKRLLRAMAAGREMTVHGLSARGTKTQDTFSLLGFSAARKAIKQGCN